METGIASWVVVARIVKAHGLSGEVVVESLTDVEGRLENTPVFLLIDGGHVRGEIRVKSRRFFGGRFAFTFEGISNRSEAEKLRGMELAVAEEELGELPPDQFFIHQLVGMTVRLQDGKVIGTVRNVLKTGGVDLLEIGERGEILIPFAADICVEVDTKKRLITIVPPEGLLQINAD